MGFQRRCLLALLAIGLSPAFAREVPTTLADSWQSVVRIADVAFIPPSENNEDVSPAEFLPVTTAPSLASTSPPHPPHPSTLFRRPAVPFALPLQANLAGATGCKTANVVAKRCSAV